MRQYQALKDRHPDAVLFFRLGDFYELFGEDARRAAPVLELVLTQRQGIPMCGMPHHALAGYIGRLLKRGMRVAIAEQMEDAADTKGMVRREVIRVVTPGTVVEDELLTAKQNNFLAALCPGDDGKWGIAWADMSTGEIFYAQAADARRATEEAARWEPKETLWKGQAPANEAGAVGLPADAFRPDHARRWAKDHLGARDLEGFGLEDGPPLAAVSALIYYIERHQAQALAGLRPPRRHALEDHMVLDARAVERLELLPSGRARAGEPSSLWDVLDYTVTAMGGRRLKSWLLHPLLDPKAILARQDRVEHFAQAPRLRRAARDVLRETADVERVISRLASGTSTGRDLGALRRTLRQTPLLLQALQDGNLFPENHPLAAALAALNLPPELPALLEAALAEDPPFRLSEGGVIKDGYSPDLDELRGFAKHGRDWISRLEAEEKVRTGIGSLKIGFTGVFGYYLEVSKPNLPKVPPTWIRKQTLVNAERFVTPELKTQEDKILGAEEKSKALEREILAELRRKLLAHREALGSLAEALGELDALASLGEAAERGRWVRPKLVEEPVLRLKQARHPVVERVLEAPFVPNDLALDDVERQLLVVTGPNMGGKSTFLRQAALAVVMAQMGSFVPAEEAEVGIADRIFTRIGAGDNLSRGASTFMVEMEEVANVLHNATPRSLVILDEIGRGTSTYDGLAVAWAVAEALAGGEKPGPRTLLATHYFEMTELAEKCPRMKNHHAAVREWTRPDGKTELVFLHQILPGAADRSYGVHVAQMAGLPAACVARAKLLLSELEAGRVTKNPAPSSEKRPELFSTHPVLEILRAADPDRLTPMDALRLVAELKMRISRESK